MTLLLALQLIKNKVSNLLSQICESSLRISPAKKIKKLLGSLFLLAKLLPMVQKKSSKYMTLLNISGYAVLLTAMQAIRYRSLLKGSRAS